MHPQAFLKTFWRLELRPQVFVAMSFDPKYQDRFDKVIAPAIKRVLRDGQMLQPYRTDISKSGDFILTDIVDRIAHSQLVLADVSVIGQDSVSGVPYRNANVLYEVGIALACRHSSEVLLLRDDTQKFLFDVSSVPHMKVDFTNAAQAIPEITEALEARLHERQLLNDARIELAIAGLSSYEIRMLKQIAAHPHSTKVGWNSTGINLELLVPLPSLLDKQLIRLAGEFENGDPAYELTPLGSVVVTMIKSGLPRFRSDLKPGVENIGDDGAKVV